MNKENDNLIDNKESFSFYFIYFFFYFYFIYFFYHVDLIYICFCGATQIEMVSQSVALCCASFV